MDLTTKRMIRIVATITTAFTVAFLLARAGGLLDWWSVVLGLVAAVVAATAVLLVSRVVSLAR